ncbi:MAG TPA: glycine oxidase ThiO [Pyrinomonadaceae bacterium]|nr:glycine oxidase ThiO [Pyrinomonadaceae bacterium]
MRKGEDLRAPADVAVVGGGVVGLAVAREAARRGLSVAVVEGRRPGAGASGAAGGMLAPQAEAARADEFFDLLCASRDMYPHFAEALREETGVDVELDRTGTLYLGFGEEDAREMEARLAWQTRAGLAVERLSVEDVRASEPAVSPRVRAALRFPRDWQVENRQLVRALASSALRAGVRIYAETEALGVRAARGRAEGVETSRGFLSAGAVVLAAGAWAARVPLLESSEGGAAARFASPHIEPVRGQMLCFEQSPSHTPALRHVVYSPRGYLVPRRDGRLLAGSTTEHAGFDVCVTAGGLHEMTTHALEIAPGVASLRLTDSWAGLRPRAADDRPVLGESAEAKSLFYATGHYRNGILLAPATGDIVADLLEGRRPDLLARGAEAFSPERFRRTLVS